MKKAALIGFWLLGTAPALALNHLQANRIHIFTPGSCATGLNPLWVTIGTGQAAPGFHNITAPQFDEIGALLSGGQPGESEAELSKATAECGAIASFFQNGAPAGAWPVTADKIPQIQAILNNNG